MELEKANILIVDDDPGVRELLSDMLTFVGGYNTNVAVDGIDGIEKVKNGSYDIIFTDLNMPRMSGIDFLKETKNICPAASVIVMTAYSTIENAISAMKEGAKDFITKPFNISRVADITSRIVGERKLLGRFLTNKDLNCSMETLNAELFKKLQEISALQSISAELDGIYNNKEIYERLVEMATRLLMVKEASFGIVENDFLKIKRAIGAKQMDIPIAGTIFEKVVGTKKHCMASFGEINPHNGTAVTSQFLSIPCTINDEVFGIMNFTNKADGTFFTEDEIHLALTFARKASLRIENNALYEVFYNNLVNNLKSLIISIEARDSYTKDHSERVTSYALEIAEAMKLDEDSKDAIRFGGYLHDIGKIGVRDTVLLKPGRLTDEEMAEIKLHPLIGDNIIKPLRFFPKERELILYHHERFDGRGYPHGIKGNEIPLIARILAIADTYDAITTSRPYREAKEHKFAVEELKRCSNRQFDGEYVHAFLDTKTGRGGR